MTILNPPPKQKLLSFVSYSRPNNKPTHRPQLANTVIPLAPRLSSHTDNTLDHNNLVIQIRNLTGLQQKIFFYVFDTCALMQSHETGPLPTSYLAQAALCSIKSAKTSLERLIKKGLVIRNKGKTSRGGFVCLSLSKPVQRATAHYKVSLPCISLGNNLANNTPNSSNYKKSITTTDLPTEWLKIDFSEIKSLGFSQTQLLQIFSTHTNTPESVQESINNLGYALRSKITKNRYQNLLNVFMGVLRRGNSWIDEGYMAHKNKLLQAKEAIKKHEQKNKVDEVIRIKQNQTQAAFDEWLLTLTEVEKQKILAQHPKPSTILTPRIIMHVERSCLFTYFKDHVLSG